MQSQLNSISDKVLGILLLVAAVLAPWMVGTPVHGSGVDPQCLGVCRGNVCRGAVLDRPGGTTGRGQGRG